MKYTTPGQTHFHLRVESRILADLPKPAADDYVKKYSPDLSDMQERVYELRDKAASGRWSEIEIAVDVLTARLKMHGEILKVLGAEPETAMDREVMETLPKLVEHFNILQSMYQWVGKIADQPAEEKPASDSLEALENLRAFLGTLERAKEMADAVDSIISPTPDNLYVFKSIGDSGLIFTYLFSTLLYEVLCLLIPMRVLQVVQTLYPEESAKFDAIFKANRSIH